jgi:hypothetical protein
VSEEIVFGGTRTYTRDAVTESTSTDGYNTWKRKTVETRPDGSTNTVYVNYIGQELLTDLQDTAGNHWITYKYYDANGRLVLSAEPSAVSGYTKTTSQYWTGNDWNGAVTFTADGLVHETVYYTATSATISETVSGGVLGYVEYEVTRRAENNSAPVYSHASPPPLNDPDVTVQGKYEYFARSAGGQTVYPVAKTIEYKSATETIETNYAYTWYTGTLQVRQQTTTLPAVSGTQNGSGVAATRAAWFDAKGNLIVQQDERGRLTYSEYAPLSGRLLRTVEDVHLVQFRPFLVSGSRHIGRHIV